MAYSIGLDVGIASVGWAVMALDLEEKPYGIIKLGVRTFDKAEDAKTGASLAFPRRKKRSGRRSNRRRHHRLDRVRYLCVSSGLVSQVKLGSLYDNIDKDVYFLRVKALDYRLSNEELVCVLLHIAKRRGALLNRKSDLVDLEKMKNKLDKRKKTFKNKLAGSDNVSDNKSNWAAIQVDKQFEDKERWLASICKGNELMESGLYRTPGEMFLKDPLFSEHKRNKCDSYLATVQRSMVLNEARLILETQRFLGNSLITDDFEKIYFDILVKQRSFDEGPGGNSQYNYNGSSLIERLVRICTFENGRNGTEKLYRASKNSYSFEYFNLLQNINHLRLLSGSVSYPLNDEQRILVIDLAKTKASVTFSDIRKKLGLDESVKFKGLDYDNEAVESKTKFNYLKAYHQLRSALNSSGLNHFDSYSTDLLDKIAFILSVYKSDEKRKEKFKEFDIPDEDIDRLLPLNFKGFGHLSIKALRKIIPFLEQGMTYDKACGAAGYDFRAHIEDKSLYLPLRSDELDDIMNPVVRRAVSQTIKVLNSIIRDQGESPVFINIELSREMAKDFNERLKLKKEMDENQKRNESLVSELRETYHVMNPSGNDIVKLKLFKEQGGVSPYSGKSFNVKKLFDNGYADIDHIVPYSISFDDSYANKVLVFSDENREKSDRLPLEYLSTVSKEAVERFRIWVAQHHMRSSKKNRLLKECITEEDIRNFKERNLNDTKYISRKLYNYINDHLLFAESVTGMKKRVRAVNGSITAFLRKRWGIRKVRSNGDKHHAKDAAVIACVTDRMIQDVTAFYKYHETHYFMKSRFPLPYDDFSMELKARCSDDPKTHLQKLKLLFYADKDLTEIKPIFVSRMSSHKVSGAAHKDSVYSVRELSNKGIIISKCELQKLKLDSSGEIKDYYNKESDLLLYKALKKRLDDFNNDAKKAFEEPFYKPKADGTKGPLVRSVKCYEKSTLNVLLNNGSAAAKNGSMVRVDVFYIKDDGYYLVPVYVSDTLKDQLPDKAIVSGKPYDSWKVMDDKDFLFSLYNNDLVRIQSKKDISFVPAVKDNTLEPKILIKDFMAYYKFSDIGTGRISLAFDDNSYCGRVGVKTLLSIEKYQVDYLGNFVKVKTEKRMGFTKKNKHFFKK